MKNNKKIVKIIMNTMKVLVSLFIVIVVSIIFVQRITNNKLNLGGYGMYTVVTESMVPKYKVGDIVFSKKVAYDQLKVKDDVVYLGKEGSFNDKIVTHQIIGKEVIDGRKALHTKGIANDTEDPIVYEEQILNKVLFKCNVLSFVSGIVNNPYGFYFVIFIPFAILLVMDVIDIVEEKKEKRIAKTKEEKM